MLGEATELFPTENLQRVKALPAICLAHGTEVWFALLLCCVLLFPLYHFFCVTPASFIVFHINPYQRIQHTPKLTPEQDSAVPVEGSRAFANKAEELHPNANIQLTLEPGEHGFDAEAKLETTWLKDGLEWVSHFWP